MFYTPGVKSALIKLYAGIKKTLTDAVKSHAAIKLILIMAAIISPFHHASADFKKPHVLYISSYNPGFPTFNQQLAGINAVLAPENVTVDIEFMDSKRFTGKSNVREFHRRLVWKINQLPQYNAVIAADDTAFNYILSERNKTFKRIPLFFCGVNNVPDVIKANSGNRLRGVLEAVSIRETLELIMTLFPERKTLAIITDSTISGQADLENVILTGKNFRFNYQILSLEHLTFSQLNDSITELDGNSSILLLSLYTDAEGEIRDFQDELKEIITHSRVPVFHLWEHGLGKGIIGGKLINHREQGRKVAEMVLAYLNGTTFKNITPPNISPNRYMFDYNILKKFGVSLSSIPEKSEVINMPESFWVVHRTEVIITAVILFFLSYSVVVLLIHKKRLTKNIYERTAELNERGVKLNMALDNTGQIAWDYDLSTDTITISRGLDEPASTETSEKKIRFDDFLNTFHPDDINMTYKLIEDHKTGKTPSFEETHRIILPDGSIKWMLVRGKIIQKNSEGVPVRMTGVSIDITYLKQIEEELRRSRQMLRLVLDTIPIGVFWKDIDHKYKGCNNFFAKEMGFNSPEEIVNRSDKDLTFREHYRDFILSDSEVLESGKPKINYEETITLSSGKKFFFRKSKIPLTDENNKITGILGTVEDITGQKQIQDKLYMIQRLESVGILAAGIAHDFNNILMGISGAISVLKFLNPSDQKSMAWVEKAESLSVTASELTSRIITFARGGEPVLAEVNLPALINEAYNYIPEDSDITLEINTDAIPEILFIDERQMRQVIRNLILNSVESIKEKGTIKINSMITETARDNSLDLVQGTYVKIIFSDTGKGIEPECMEKIFDPYYTTKEMGAVKGQGLGLPICHSIIKNHKGALTVKSSPGTGTKVNIYLPTP